MNAVASALRTAGVKLPTLRYRTWNWLRDHPAKTAEEIRVALGIPYGISTQLLAMEIDGLLKTFSDFSGHPHPMTRARFKIKRYSVTNHGLYELLDRKKQSPRKKSTLPSVCISPAVPVIAAPSAPSAPEHPFNLDNLTIKQARALYVELKEFFR